MTLSRAGLAAAGLIFAATGCNEAITTGFEADTGIEVQASVTGSPRDVAAINQIVARFDSAWGADAVTYAGQYAGADFVGPDGGVMTDPAAILGLYTFLFDVIFPGTTRQSTIRNLTFLTGTLAVVDIDTRVTGYEVAPPGVVEWAPGIIRAREKNILQKRGSQWQIIQHQQVLVAPGVP
jgi:hypothetical protein